MRGWGGVAQQSRKSDLDQGESCERGEKGMESGFALKVEWT